MSMPELPKAPPWRGRGEHFVLRFGRSPLRVRVTVVTISTLLTFWTLRSQVNKEFGRFVLLMTLAHLFPYAIYLAGVHSRKGSVIVGGALLVPHVWMLVGIVSSQSAFIMLALPMAAIYLILVASVGVVADQAVRASVLDASRKLRE